MYTYVHWRKFTNIEQRRKSTNGKEEKLDRNSDAASGTVLRISCAFKEAIRNFPVIFLNKKYILKFVQPFAHVKKILLRLDMPSKSIHRTQSLYIKPRGYFPPIVLLETWERSDVKSQIRGKFPVYGR
jgi:hypothetical protein